MEAKASPGGDLHGHAFPWYLRFHTWAAVLLTGV